jgi:hypothetical protein
MPCTDPKRRTFLSVPAGASYELSVTGPPGFAAFAQFDDGRTSTLETWPFEEISPGPKTKRVAGAGKTHVVFVFVNIDGARPIDVQVKASIAGKDYCRTVGGAGTQEIVVHTIRMA